MAKNKVIPIHFQNTQQEAGEGLVEQAFHTFAVLQIQTAQSVQKKLASEFAPKVAEADAELGAHRLLLADRYRRYEEAQRQATQMRVGEDSPPLGSFVAYLAFSAICLFELLMAVLSMQAVIS